MMLTNMMLTNMIVSNKMLTNMMPTCTTQKMLSDQHDHPDPAPPGHYPASYLLYPGTGLHDHLQQRRLHPHHLLRLPAHDDAHHLLPAAHPDLPPGNTITYPPMLTSPQPGHLPSTVTAAAKPNIYVQPQQVKEARTGIWVWQGLAGGV